MKKITITFFLLFFCVSLGSAKIYKWRDDKGTLVFSDTPPENGEIASPVNVQESPSAIENSKVYTQEVLKSYPSESPHKRTTIPWNSDEYVFNEVENAKEYLDLLSHKTELGVKDIIMADYIQYIFQHSAAMPYLNQSDKIRAKYLGQRGGSAERLLSEREKEIASKALDMMIGRWESETYQELNESEIKVLDAKIQKLWAEMCSAMAEADMGKTLSYFHTSTQSAYRRRFTTLSRENLQRFSADMSQPIHFVKDTAGLLEYALFIERQGQVYSQIIIFEAENNGEWKIKKF